MGSLRVRLAEEVYQAAEGLGACLECDFREAPGNRRGGGRQPTPVDVAHLRRFHGKLAASAGPLQALLLVYLRTYESLRAVLHHRAQKRIETSAHRVSAHTDPLSDGGVLLGDALCPLDSSPEPPGDGLLAKRTNALLPDLRALWLRQRRGVDTDQDDSDGPTANDDAALRGRAAAAAKRAQAALYRENAERLTYLPGDREGYGQVCSHAKVRAGCAHCTAEASTQAQARSKLGYSDGGAGPADFWSQVGRALPGEKSGGRGKPLPLEKLEASLWRLALLVRCQDRAQGLKLHRKEPMRKLLDTRFYEVIAGALSDHKRPLASRIGNAFVDAPRALWCFLTRRELSGAVAVLAANTRSDRRRPRGERRPHAALSVVQAAGRLQRHAAPRASRVAPFCSAPTDGARVRSRTAR
jgi:hypothetical protein